MVDKRKGLLDDLSDMLHCAFLSDLKYVRITQKQAERIMEIENQRYPLEEFNEAATYLFNKPCRFECAEDAKKAIVGRLTTLYEKI